MDFETNKRFSEQVLQVFAANGNKKPKSFAANGSRKPSLYSLWKQEY